jgi:DNA mismatch endonuclease (patch repair protein)
MTAKRRGAQGGHARASVTFAGRHSSSEAASKVGRANKSRDTEPEMALRRALWRLGYRYRLEPRRVFGRPDLVLPRHQVAIFCDGDFWHGRDWPQRRAKLLKGANAEYWVAKIESNIERDRRVTRELRRQGWTVLRIWEGDLRRNPAATVKKVQRVLNRRSLNA